VSLVHPVFKGHGKLITAPASYRPVSIRPAMSKVLEISVKEDLEQHLKATSALPDSEHGFRLGRSCSTALAAAHAKWSAAAASRSKSSV
jgi:hypothetical protein